MNGARAIATALVEAGVRVAFGLPGVHNLALWPACAEAGVRIVGSRHEQGCAYAADGFARSTAGVGVALVTTGPGAANTLGAVGEAWACHSPVVVVATDIPSGQRRPGRYRGVLHECTDQAAMFAPVTVARVVAEPGDDLGALASAACRAAVACRGPVYLGVPTDLLTAPNGTAERQIDTSTQTELGTGTDTSPAASLEASLAAAADLLAASRRPLLWVGGGARDAGDELDALARHLGAAVITSYTGRGALPGEHPHLVPAPPHEPQVIELARRADATIVLGSDLDAMNTMAWALPLPAPRVAVNLSAADATKNYAMDAVLACDAAQGARALRAALAPREPWFGDLVGLRREVRDALRAAPETGSSVGFLEATERAVLAHRPRIFADMCIPGYWLAGHYGPVAHRGLHYPMGWGTLGWAFPAAIGAAAAGQATVAVMGDGGMQFALGELGTVAQEELPLVVVVVDDGGYGMLRFGRAQEATGSDLRSVDFAAAARAFGVPATHIDGRDGFDGPGGYGAILEQAVAAGRPHLIHLHAELYPPHSTSPRWPIKP